MKDTEHFNTGGGFAPSPHGDRKGSLEGRSRILIATVLVAVLMLTSLIMVSCDDTVESEGTTTGTSGELSYTLDGNTLAFSGTGAMGNYDSTGPWGTAITVVEIPEGVTSIGSFAFKDCTALTSILIPDSVTYIGNSAFSGCTDLTDVEMGSGVTTIGDSAFYNCGSLSSITLSTTTSYGGYINLPGSVQTIGETAFYGCRSMYSVDVPGSAAIKKEAFYQCTFLTLLEIPSVTEIGERAFGSCALGEVTIPGSVEAIQSWAFSNCDDMESLTISEGVKTIGSGAFTGCTALTKIVFPKSLTTISDIPFGSHMFYDTDGVTLLNQTVVGDIKDSTFKGDDVDHMIKQGTGPAPDIEPDDQPSIIIPDDSDDYIPWYVPVQRTDETSDDTSQVVAIVGAIAALLAIIVFLVYWRDD